MKLSRLRSLVRPVVSLPNEYRIRSLANAVVPHQPPAVRRGYHFCNWKTGSQWVRLVLSDPRLYRHTGLPARLHHNGVGRLPILVRHQYPPSERFLATPLFAGSELLHDIEASADDRAVFVTRHPRDLLVSFYFCNLETHPLNPDVMHRRRELRSLDPEAGLLRTMDHGFDEMVRIGDSWQDAARRSDPGACPVVVVEYESLTDHRASASWQALLDHIAGRPIPADLVRSLLRTYSADSMRSSDPTKSKLRERSTASWEQHFTDEVDREFRRRYGDVEERWGYAPNHRPMEELA